MDVPQPIFVQASAEPNLFGLCRAQLKISKQILSFLTSYNFAGKTVIPFCTHDGYGAGRTYASVRNTVPGAPVLEGIAIEATDVPSSGIRVIIVTAYSKEK